MPPRLLLVATVVALIALVSGIALGAVTVSHKTQTGSGTSVGGGYLGYWKQVDADNLSTVPAGTTTLSTTVGAPTTLAAAATTYALNAATTGHAAFRWNMTESTSAPTSTELELMFKIVTGATFAVTVLTVYVETRATALGAAVTFSLVYDEGSTTAPILDSALQISQQCTSVGQCP